MNQTNAMNDQSHLKNRGYNSTRTVPTLNEKVLY